MYLVENSEIIIPGIKNHPDYPEISDYIETNDQLIQKLSNKKMPRYLYIRNHTCKCINNINRIIFPFSVEFNQFKSDKFSMAYNYEMWIPDGLELQNAKKHSVPLLMEIYGGPGSTKVTSSWKKSYTQDKL